jgi:hypothetical protein
MNATQSHPHSPKRLAGAVVPAGALILAAVSGLACGAGEAKLVVGGYVGVGLLAAFIRTYQISPPRAIVVIWFLQVLQAPLAASVGYNSSGGHAVREATDGLVLLVTVFTVWAIALERREVRGKGIVAVLVTLIGVGWVSGFLHGDEVSTSAVGMWLAIKIWLLISVSIQHDWLDSFSKDQLYAVVTGVGVVAAILGVVDFLGHGIVAQTLHTNIATTPGGGAYRSTAVQSIFIFPNEYSLFMATMAAFSMARYAEQRRGKDLLLVALFCGAGFLSLRLKGVLSVAAVFMIVALIRSRRSKTNPVTVIGIGILVAIAVFSFEGSIVTTQVQTYTAAGQNNVRGLLYETGLRIANNLVPFGDGFGRYASDTSRTHYSPVYYQYGLSNVFGLSPAQPLYIDDTSWPSVMGETGYFGLLTVLTGFVLLVRLCIAEVRSRVGYEQWWGVLGLCTVAVTLVDSLGDPTLFDWLAALTLAIVFGVMYSAKVERESGQLANHLAGDLPQLRAGSSTVAGGESAGLTTPGVPELPGRPDRRV